MGGMWVGGSGNPKAVTVFGVLVGDRSMPLPSTSPAHMPTTSVVDRPGRCIYLRVNDDGDVSAEEAEEAAEEKLSVSVGDGDEETEVDCEVRDSGVRFGLWRSFSLAGELLQMRMLGGWSRPAGTMGVCGTYVVVLMVVVFGPATPNVEGKPPMVVLEPFLALEVMVGGFGRESDATGGIGGIGAVGGFIGGGIIFTASSDPRSTAPGLPSSLGEFK